MSYGAKVDPFWSRIRGLNPKTATNIFSYSAWRAGQLSQDDYLIIDEDWFDDVMAYAQALTSSQPTPSSVSPDIPLGAVNSELAKGDVYEEARYNYTYTDKYGQFRHGFTPVRIKVAGTEGSRRVGWITIIAEALRTYDSYANADRRKTINQHAGYAFKASRQFFGAEAGLPDDIHSSPFICANIVNCIIDGRLPPMDKTGPRTPRNSFEYQKMVAAMAMDIKVSGKNFVFEERLVETTSPTPNWGLDRPVPPLRTVEVQKPSGSSKIYYDRWHRAFPQLNAPPGPRGDIPQKVFREPPPIISSR